MNKYAKEWLKALRSGEYEQGKNALCELPDQGPAEFCCLGVAEDIFNEVSITPGFGGDGFKCRSKGCGPDEYLSAKTQKLLGLRTSSGGGTGRGSLRPLAVMNDAGSSFKQIAAHLEKHEAHYFIQEQTT